MVRIRLRRVGAKNKPAYRVIVADSRSPRDGAFIEVIGHYDPLANPEVVNIDKEKAVKWLNCGAQPSSTVARLLTKVNITLKSKLGANQTSGAVKTGPIKSSAITTKET
jgi:small subunit ribosomal protein S16